MNTKLKAIVAVASIAALLVVGVAMAATYLTIPSSGNFVGAASIVSSPTSIDWGNINVGSTAPINKNIDLTNTGGQTSQPLKLTYTTTFGTITWSGEGTTIGPGATITYTVTFTPVASPPAGPFNIALNIGT
jgi:hypothetical protein